MIISREDEMAIENCGELLVMSHNDADACGCMLNIEYKWPDIPKKYFHTNYANIPEIVQEILDYQKENGNQHLLIPDVSFSDNKEHLTTLYNAFEHVTHIDHHLYPDGFWDDYPNMKVVWDKSKSATLLCNEYLGNKGKNANLDKLSYIIDVYDLWQKDDPAFGVSQDFNQYFWTHGTTDLAQVIINNSYRLPDDYVSEVQKSHMEFEQALMDYENRNLIHRFDKVTVAFIQEWFNQVLIKEMDNGQDIVIGANQYGIIRVRINQDSPYKDWQLDKLRLELTGTKDIGHMHAFTYKVHGSVSFDKIMAEVKNVLSKIGEL
jgi:hypothetical protein